MPDAGWSLLTSSLFDALDTGLILLDRDRRVVAWNAWMASASKIDADAAIGETLEGLFPDARLGRLFAVVASVMDSGTSGLLTHSLHPQLLPLRTRAGRPLIHDIAVRAVGQGSARQCLVQVANVTVAVEREHVLRERQNARYDAVVDSAPDVILTLDADDTIQLVNPAAARQFGYEAHELIGQPAGVLFEDRDAWRAMRSAVLVGDSTRQPAEIVARRKDGTPSYLEVSLSRWRSDSRVFITAILRDVNERRGAEEKLRASEAQFRSMAQAAPNHVWTAPPDGRLDWFNDRVYEYGGVAPGKLDAETWANFLHPEDIEATTARWTAAVTTGEPYEAQFRLRRADSAYRWHIARAFPVRNAAGEVIRWVGSNTDIEDQKVAAQALADLNATLEQRVQERTGQLMQAEEALRQSQKMEAVGQLTGGIAHDFNNLLQGIIGSLDRVQKRISEGRIADVGRFLNGAVDAANRAAALTHRLLAFSRRQPVDPRPVDVNQLIATIEELLRRSIGESIRLETPALDDIWLVRCDANQLENALLNLAINARDAMPDGGTVTVETAQIGLNEAEARRLEVAAGDFVRLRVRDTGVGMPPDVKARAFDPFYTTKPIGQGTGLGLSMIYGFVRQSEGAVQIVSEPGKGTTIEIYLPRFRGDAEQPTADDPSAQDDNAGKDEIILVVEDEAVVRLLIADVLADLGYRVLEAADGTAALRILESAQRIDLLVSDIGLPGLNGRQLADAARVKRPTLKVLFMTGYAENAAGKSFLADGMEIITKPFTTDVLATKIREMIESRPRA